MGACNCKGNEEKTSEIQFYKLKDISKNEKRKINLI